MVPSRVTVPAVAPNEAMSTRPVVSVQTETPESQTAAEVSHDPSAPGQARVAAWEGRNAAATKQARTRWLGVAIAVG
jgi:hypothetical protein